MVPLSEMKKAFSTHFAGSDDPTAYRVPLWAGLLDPLSRSAQRDLGNPVSRARLEHLQAHALHRGGCLEAAEPLD
jgi:hypothetical protein